MLSRIVLASSVVLLLVPGLTGPETRAAVGEKTRKTVVEQLIGEHGAAQEPRIRQGVRQVAQHWWDEDGDEESFAAFCTEHFLSDEEQLTSTFLRLQDAIEQIDGHLHETLTPGFHLGFHVSRHVFDRVVHRIARAIPDPRAKSGRNPPPCGIPGKTGGPKK